MKLYQKDTLNNMKSCEQFHREKLESQIQQTVEKNHISINESFITKKH